MEKNVPAEWDKYQKGGFYPGFLIIVSYGFLTFSGGIEM